jgi:hypothetical protein
MITEQQLKEKNNITRLISRDNINSLRIDLKEPGNYFYTKLLLMDAYR